MNVNLRWIDGVLVPTTQDVNEALRASGQSTCPACGHDITRHQEKPHTRASCSETDCIRPDCILAARCQHCDGYMGANTVAEWQMILGFRCESCRRPNWYAGSGDRFSTAALA